jgi:hypothetical protein
MNSAISTLQKDLEENNLNTDNIINDTKDNNKDKLDSLSIKENQKSEDNTKNLKLNNDNDNDNNTKLRKTNSLMMKSSSSIYNINENIDIVQEDPKKNFLFSKSKTIMGNVQNNKKLNVIPNLLNFNGHLDTVIETVSEVSNSKIGSKHNESKFKLNSKIESPKVNKKFNN